MIDLTNKYTGRLDPTEIRERLDSSFFYLDMNNRKGAISSQDVLILCNQFDAAAAKLRKLIISRTNFKDEEDIGNVKEV